MAYCVNWRRAGESERLAPYAMLESTSETPSQSGRRSISRRSLRIRAESQQGRRNTHYYAGISSAHLYCGNGGCEHKFQNNLVGICAGSIRFSIPGCGPAPCLEKGKARVVHCSDAVCLVFTCSISRKNGDIWFSSLLCIS